MEWEKTGEKGMKTQKGSMKWMDERREETHGQSTREEAIRDRFLIKMDESC